jgi:hypothetical protein
MAIDFLLILFLKAKENLRGDNSTIWIFEMKIGIESKSCCVFEKVGCDIDFVDFAQHVVARLVNAKQSEAIQNAWMNFISPIGNNADEHLHGLD